LRRLRLLATDADGAPANAWYDNTRSLLSFAQGDLLVCCNLGTDTVPVPEAEGATLLLGDDATCSEGAHALTADSVAIWSGAERAGQS
jgi:hypothetical protein